jgi:hypothetical protein
MIQEYLSDLFNTWTGTDHGEVLKTVLGSDLQRVRFGEIIALEYIIGNASNPITMTFNLYDHHWVKVHSKATIAVNGTTIERLKYVATPTTTIPIFGEGFVIGFDPSGDSGATKITGQVRIYYES